MENITNVVIRNNKKVIYKKGMKGCRLRLHGIHWEMGQHIYEMGFILLKYYEL